MINSMSGLQSVSYAAYFGAGGMGKVYVPVSPNNVQYSQFAHISGYASRVNDSGSSGVSVDKIRVLNTLIDQLVSIKKQPAEKQDVTVLSDNQIDAIIQEYQGQIKNALKSARENPYALTPSAPQGILFDFAA